MKRKILFSSVFHVKSFFSTITTVKSLWIFPENIFWYIGQMHYGHCMLFKLILYVKACPTCSSTSFLLKAEEMSEEWCGRAPLSWTFRWLSEFCFHQQCWCEYSCPLAHLYFGEIPTSASAKSKRICFRNFG